jgi:hypothetical protein
MEFCCENGLIKAELQLQQTGVAGEDAFLRGADGRSRRLAGIVDLRRRASQVGGERAFGVAGSVYPYALKTPTFL